MTIKKIIMIMDQSEFKLEGAGVEEQMGGSETF